MPIPYEGAHHSHDSHTSLSFSVASAFKRCAALSWNICMSTKRNKYFVVSVRSRMCERMCMSECASVRTCVLAIAHVCACAHSPWDARECLSLCTFVLVSACSCACVQTAFCSRIHMKKRLRYARVCACSCVFAKNVCLLMHECMHACRFISVRA